MKKIIAPLLFGSAVLLSLQMMSCTKNTEPKTESQETNSNSEIESNKKIVLDFAVGNVFQQKSVNTVSPVIQKFISRHSDI